MTVRHDVKKKLHGVPEYSQFLDVDKEEWKNRSCGIVSLSMVMNYFNYHFGGAILTHWLIERAMERGDCYLDGIGWKHSGLISLAKEFDFEGERFDFYDQPNKKALKKFFCLLEKGPVIVSVFNGFNPKNKGGHLVVAKGYEKSNGHTTIFINDPATRDKSEKKSLVISLKNFTKGWKRRFISITDTDPRSHK